MTYINTNACVITHNVFDVELDNFLFEFKKIIICTYTYMF